MRRGAIRRLIFQRPGQLASLFTIRYLNRILTVARAAFERNRCLCKML